MDFQMAPCLASPQPRSHHLSSASQAKCKHPKRKRLHLARFNHHHNHHNQAMKLHTLVEMAVAAALATTTAAARHSTTPPSPNAVLLSQIQTLTLRSGRQTSHRRVPAIPQLRCVGGNARGKYDVDVMRCANAGSSYNGADVEWSCTASLPEEFKLGSTDVVCEGYASPDDEWVLKGSCGVEYRLVLTPLGEEKFGKGIKGWFGGWNEGMGGSKSEESWRGSPGKEEATAMGTFVSAAFWLLFVGVLVWMVFSWFTQRNAARRPGAGRGNPRPWGGGGGGGGGGGFWPRYDDTDPPPPYSPYPKSNPFYSAAQSWRPGFWSGAGAGAAAGYAAARAAGGWGGRNTSFNDNGEGSSRGSRRNSGSPGSSGLSGTRYTSTGFGSTSRR